MLIVPIYHHNDVMLKNVGFDKCEEIEKKHYFLFIFSRMHCRFLLEQHDLLDENMSHDDATDIVWEQKSEYYEHLSDDES